MTERRRDITRVFKIVFALSFLSVFTPWFDIGADTSPAWGIEALVQNVLLIPFVAGIVFLCEKDRPGLLSVILMEAAFACGIGVYIDSFLYFQGYYWPALVRNEVVNLQASFQSATPFFWISAGLFILTVILFQFCLAKKLKDAPGKKELKPASVG